jgi:hypothetical protein
LTESLYSALYIHGMSKYINDMWCLQVSNTVAYKKGAP